jgi:hypothetical protein
LRGNSLKYVVLGLFLDSSRAQGLRVRSRGQVTAKARNIMFFRPRFCILNSKTLLFPKKHVSNYKKRNPVPLVMAN